MSVIFSFLWANRKWVAYLAVAAAVVLVLLRFSHSRFEAGRAAGQAEISAKWHEAKLAQQRAYEDALAATAAKIEHDRQAAAEVERDLQTKLAAADASGRDLGRRLSDYIARSRRCAVSAGAATPGQPDASGAPGGDPEAGAVTAVYRAVEDTLAECKTNAADLDAWYSWASKVTP